MHQISPWVVLLQIQNLNDAKRRYVASEKNVNYGYGPLFKDPKIISPQGQDCGEGRQ